MTARSLVNSSTQDLAPHTIERIFGHWKRCQGYRIVRYIGLVKNQLELTLKAVTYNLRRLVTLATA